MTTTVSTEPPTTAARHHPDIPPDVIRQGRDSPGHAGTQEAHRSPGHGGVWTGGEVVRVGTAMVRLRRVVSGDGPALVAVLKRMSLRTRWLRFHSPIVRFSGAQLRMLLDADHRDRSVLLAEVEIQPGRWQLVGFAQYARIAGDRADAAIVLEDAWQGRGVGRTLALALVRAARAAGIAAFTSEILTENRRMLAFASALAQRTEGRLLGVTTELTCWLDPA